MINTVSPFVRLGYALKMSYTAPTSTEPFPAELSRPDYDGSSIVNLMSSIGTGRGADAGAYKPLQLLADLSLSRYLTYYWC